MVYLFLWASVMAIPSAALPVSAHRDCADCPELVRIAQAPPARPRDKPIAWASKYETTWAEYLQAVVDAGCASPQLLFGGLADPADESLHDRVAVTGVSIEDAECYASWLTNKTGKHYRLPTSSEWEAIARAGVTTAYPWGDELGFNNAFVIGAYDWKRFEIPNFLGPRSPSNIQVVGQLRPNANGMYDVIGNATELTSTLPSLVAACGDTAKCQRVVARGARVSQRSRLSDIVMVGVQQRDAGVGFRLVRE